MGVAPFHVGQRNLMNESPLFVRTYDFLLWLMPQSQKFPRIYRFTLAERVQRLALDFQDTLVAAGKSKGTSRFEKLKSADIQLEQLRTWIRFAAITNYLRSNNTNMLLGVCRKLADCWARG